MGSLQLKLSIHNLICNLCNTAGPHFRGWTCFYELRKAIIALWVAFCLPPSPKGSTLWTKMDSQITSGRRGLNPKWLVFTSSANIIGTEMIICSISHCANKCSGSIITITLFWTTLYIQIIFVWSLAQWCYEVISHSIVHLNVRTNVKANGMTKTLFSSHVLAVDDFYSCSNIRIGKATSVERGSCLKWHYWKTYYGAHNPFFTSQKQQETLKLKTVAQFTGTCSLPKKKASQKWFELSSWKRGSLQSLTLPFLPLSTSSTSCNIKSLNKGIWAPKP